MIQRVIHNFYRGTFKRLLEALQFGSTARCLRYSGKEGNLIGQTEQMVPF